MIEPGNGVLLISDPFLKDPNFMRTVVLLCEHTTEGSFGLVLNRKTAHTLGDLVTHLEGITIPVFYGGPVQKDTLHFIHQLPELIPDSQEIAKGIYWGGDFVTVTELLINNQLNASKIRFYLGYSGWSGGQLKDEMKEKTWLTVQATKQLVFEKEEQSIWKKSLQQMGGEYEQLINYPIDPQLN
jgi:putative transcriptional regulator